MKRYLITTLGCKVNQCESAAIAASLDQSGYHEVSGQPDPDLVIINTCAVTARAAMQSRQAVRQAVRRHPQAVMMVTGCYAQIAPQEISAITGVDWIVGHDRKLQISELAAHPPAPTQTLPVLIWQESGHQRDFAPLASAANEHRTRAFLKIQDGCNTRCTYCMVPIARGRSRSMPVADVLDHLDRLGRQGFHEAVLTGIHLGVYGVDLEPPTSLSALLTALKSAAPVDRIRLSSIEPTEIDHHIIAQMADPAGGLCRHVHIPLQSGDNTILKRMGRPYLREQFAQIVTAIHQAIPQAAIGVDVLAGFPGEDDAAFANTYALIEQLPISYLHVFPFSARPGTPAAGFKDPIHPNTIKLRCRRLRRLGETKRAQFYNAQIGSRAMVLVETAQDARTGMAGGTSDHYIPVAVAGKKISENSLVMVRIEAVRHDGLVIGSQV